MMRKAVISVAVVAVSTLLQGCKKGEQEPLPNEEGTLDKVLLGDTAQHLRHLKMKKCDTRRTHNECIHVVFDMSYKEMMQLMSGQDEAAQNARSEFRTHFLKACELLGQEDVSIEFMPVNGRTQGIAKVTYRVFQRRGLSSTVDLEAFGKTDTQPRQKVHMNDGNPKLVEVFNARNLPGATKLLVPVMHLQLTEAQQQSFRHIFPFMADASLAEYHQSLLQTLAREFILHMATTEYAYIKRQTNSDHSEMGEVTERDVFKGANIYINTEGTDTKWLAIRFDFHGYRLSRPEENPEHKFLKNK